MDALLERLKRERRWTIAIFLAMLAFGVLARTILAPESETLFAMPSKAALEALP